MARVVFMGTPQFALSCLQALVEAGHEIPLVLCQPDKKQGRGQKFHSPPVKQYAESQGIEVYQPKGLKNPEAEERLKAIEADFFVVVAYGKILPQNILDLPSQGCINVHASLLPAYRGAAPIHFSLLNGDEETGVTTMLMDEGMDTGDMLLKATTKIARGENILQLTERLAKLGADLLIKTLKDFSSIIPEQQINDQATYTRLLTKEDSKIDWSKSAKEIYQQSRALLKLHTQFRGKRFLLIDFYFTEGANEHPPGYLYEDQGEWMVSTVKGSLILGQVQPESKKAMTISDWVNGFQIKNGERFDP